MSWKIIIIAIYNLFHKNCMIITWYSTLNITKLIMDWVQINDLHISVKCMLCWIVLCVNTLRPRQNDRRFADDTFKRIFFNENARISIKISLKFVPKGPINNNTALVQIMDWRRSGDKPLSEPMMVSFLMHICITQPQWVKQIAGLNFRDLIEENITFVCWKQNICNTSFRNKIVFEKCYILVVDKLANVVSVSDTRVVVSLCLSVLLIGWAVGLSVRMRKVLIVERKGAFLFSNVVISYTIWISYNWSISFRVQYFGDGEIDSLAVVK